MSKAGKYTTTVQFSEQFSEDIRKWSAQEGVSLGAYIETNLKESELTLQARLSSVTDEIAQIEKLRAAEIMLISSRHDRAVSELRARELRLKREYESSLERLLMSAKNSQDLSEAAIIKTGVLWICDKSGDIWPAANLDRLILSILNCEDFSSREQAVSYLLNLNRGELTQPELRYLRQIELVKNNILSSLRNLDATFGASHTKTMTLHLRQFSGCSVEESATL